MTILCRPVTIPRAIVCLAFVLGAILGSSRMATAQPPESPSSLPDLSGKPLVVDADTVTYDQEAGIIRGSGNVTINYQGVLVRAGQAQAQIQGKQIIAEREVVLEHQEITLRGEYLTYDVTSKRGALLPSAPGERVPDGAVVEALYHDQRIEAERIDFDLIRQEAVASARVILYHGAARLSGEELRYNFQTQQADWTGVRFAAGPWYGYASRAQRVSDERVDFPTAFLTTCEHDSPHYRIQARRVEYYVDDYLVARHARFFVGNVPVFYVPYWRQSLAENQSNFSVSGGHKKEWGWFALTTYRQQLNEQVKARLHLDQRQLKGFASGLDLDYSLPQAGEGAVKTYYMNERDKYRDAGPERERYRGQLKHRWQVDSATLALVEYNKMSDREFIKDYLYQEYAADAQPISQAAWTHTAPAYTLGFYARAQTNPFYTEVERLPEVRYTHNSHALADTRLYYRHDIAAANLNAKIADSSEGAQANRLDMYHELKYPTRLPGGLGWITLTPQVATRQTYYSRDGAGREDNFWRGIYYYGGEASTQFYRLAPFEGSFLGTRFYQVRHVITPSVRYSFINEPTVSSHKLGAFDEIDGIGGQNILTLGVQNHVQTKWPTDKSDQWDRVDVVYVYPRVAYYPGRDGNGRHFSLITTEFDLRPQRWLHVNSDTVYDQYRRRFQSALFDIGVRGAERWRVSVGKRYDREISDQTTGEAFVRVNDLWQARAYGRYEALTDTFQEQQYTVSRDLHCWLLDVTYSIKKVSDGSAQDRAIWFVFRLKAFPDETPVRFQMGYDTVNR